MPVFVSFLAMIATCALLITKRNDMSAFVLTLIVGNSLMQMCIDFFPGTTKPTFSALARVIPLITAVAAYLSR